MVKSKDFITQKEMHYICNIKTPSIGHLKIMFGWMDYEGGKNLCSPKLNSTRNLRHTNSRWSNWRARSLRTSSCAWLMRLVSVAPAWEAMLEKSTCNTESQLWQGNTGPATQSSAEITRNRGKNRVVVQGCDSETTGQRPGDSSSTEAPFLTSDASWQQRPSTTRESFAPESGWRDRL